MPTFEKGTQLVKLVFQEGAAVVTLNRPPANALSELVVGQLQQVFYDLQWSDITAIIITGQGDHSFSSGADIRELYNNGLEANKDYFAKVYAAFNLIAGHKYPVIAAINGYAFGAGLELALCADIRVMDEKAQLSATGVNLNLVFCTQRLQRLVGPGRARDMLFCARRVGAQEASQYGLAEHLAPAGKSLDQALQIARIIGEKGQEAVWSVKQVLNQGMDLPLSEALQLEEQQIYSMFATPEFTRRARRFLKA